MTSDQRPCPTCGYDTSGNRGDAGVVRCPECGEEHERSVGVYLSPRVARLNGLFWSMAGNIVLAVLAGEFGAFHATEGLSGVCGIVLVLWLVLGPPLVLGLQAQDVAPEWRPGITRFTLVCWLFSLLFGVLAAALLVHL